MRSVFLLGNNISVNGKRAVSFGVNVPHVVNVKVINNDLLEKDRIIDNVLWNFSSHRRPF
jgi:hypothetical protein